MESKYTDKKIMIIGAGLIGREHASLVSANLQSGLVGMADITSEGKEYADSITYLILKTVNRYWMK